MSTKYQNSRDVPMDTIIARLKELSDAVIGGRESQGREFTMRIPAECDRDADLVIAEAAARLAKLHAENEALRERLENYEALKRMHRLDNYPNELSAKAWLLRKQAEAVGAAVEQSRDHLNECAWPLGGIPDDAEHALQEVEEHAQRLRQQADEAEQAGGEK